MVTIDFLGPIARDSIELEVASLQELKEQLAKDESLKMWLASSAVAVNDVMVQELNHPLKSGDRVAILPPVCGG